MLCINIVLLISCQDSDVHISYEDQQKINKFARHNARLEDFKDELNIKINELKNLDEACEELILMSDDANVPFLVGEVFICRNLEETQVYTFLIHYKLHLLILSAHLI